MDDEESQKSGSVRSEPSAPPYPPQSPPPPVSTTMEPPRVDPNGSTQHHHHQQQQYYSTTTHQQHSTTNLHIEINAPPAVGIPVGPPAVVAEQTNTAVIIVEEERWTCCGMGFGWFLFVIGWFLCGIPWFAGFFILVCGRYNRRERSGLLACATFAIVVSVVAIIQAIKGDNHRS